MLSLSFYNHKVIITAIQKYGKNVGDLRPLIGSYLMIKCIRNLVDISNVILFQSYHEFCPFSEKGTSWDWKTRIGKRQSTEEIIRNDCV